MFKQYQETTNKVLVDFLEKTIKYHEKHINNLKDKPDIIDYPDIDKEISLCNTEIEIMREMIIEVSVKNPIIFSLSKNKIARKYLSDEYDECAHKMAHLLKLTEKLKFYPDSELDMNNKLKEISKLTLKYTLIYRMMYLCHTESLKSKLATKFKL